MRKINLRSFKQRHPYADFKRAARECTFAATLGAASKNAVTSAAAVALVEGFAVFEAMGSVALPLLTVAAAAVTNLAAVAVMARWKKAQEEVVRKNAALSSGYPLRFRRLYMQVDMPDYKMDRAREFNAQSYRWGQLVPALVGAAVPALAKLIF